jgi:hypothetical protein
MPKNLRSEVTNNVDNEENSALGGLHGKIASTCVARNWMIRSSLDQEIKHDTWRSQKWACGISGESEDQEDDKQYEGVYPKTC